MKKKIWGTLLTLMFVVATIMAVSGITVNADPYDPYDPDTVYTVTLDPGDGTGTPIVFRSDECVIAADFHDAGDCQFYIEGDGSLAFCLNWYFCPDSFTAPEGYRFSEWIGNNRYNKLTSYNTVFTASWVSIKPGDSLTYSIQNNVLTISGTGDMYDFNALHTTTPWKNDSYNISSIVIEDGVTSISPEAFEEFRSLRNVSLPDSITKIGERAFYSCGELQSICIPNSLQRIENLTFGSCNHLKVVTIPANVTIIDSAAFIGCSSITDIYCQAYPISLRWAKSNNDFMRNNGTKFHVQQKYYDQFVEYHGEANVTFVGDLCGDQVVWEYDEETKTLTISGTGNMFDFYQGGTNWESIKDEVTAIVIENGVTSVGNYAFYGFTSLTSVTMPAGIKKIGNYSFGNCYSLSSVTVPASVISIDDCAFYDSGLSEITFAGSVKSIGHSAFAYCDALETVELPDGLETLGYVAFNECENLKTVVVPNSVTDIGYGAFNDCINLETVNISTGMTSLNHGLFYNCKSLKSIEIPDNIEFIDYSVFCGSGLESVTIPDSVETIGEAAFFYTHLTSIEIPASVTTMGSYAFASNNLTSVTLAEGLTVIGNSAFNNNPELEEITIPGSMGNFGGYAFSECEKLTKITLCDGITTITQSAFADCKSLTTINIPDTVTSIGCFAFGGCDSLGSIYIPDSVTTIEGAAFEGCKSLTNVRLSDNLDCLSEEIFCNCSSLEEIAIPDKVVFILPSAFNSCTSLSTVNLPSSLYSIGDFAFTNCWSLESIYLPDGLNDISNGAFCGCTNLKTINIPDSVYFLGEQAFSACENLETVKLPNSINEISSQLFSGCYSLKSVNIPNSVERISSYAFLECTAMESIVVPCGVREIGEKAFMNCYSLKSVTLPESIIYIDGDAFFNCTSVNDVYLFAPCVVLEWNDSLLNDFKITSIEENKTKCHVLSEHLEYYIYCQGQPDFNANVVFVGDANEIFMGSGNTHLYGYSLSLDGSIGVNFYMTVNESLTGADSKAYMLFTINGRTTKVMVKDLTANADGYYIFRCDVVAKEMSDIITAQLYALDGVPAGPSYSFCVRDYCQYLLNHGDQKTVDLVTAMVNYGACSQRYFKHNVNSLANMILEPWQRSLDAVPESDISGYVYSGVSQFDTGTRIITLNSASLSTKSELVLNFYFNGLPTDTVVKCNGEVITTPLKSDGTYTKVSVTGIKVQDIYEDYTLTFTCDGVNFSLTYSPMNYCYNVITRPLTATRTQELKDTIASLYWFSKAAENYMAN